MAYLKNAACGEFHTKCEFAAAQCFCFFQEKYLSNSMRCNTLPASDPALVCAHADDYKLLCKTSFGRVGYGRSAGLDLVLAEPVDEQVAAALAELFPGPDWSYNTEYGAGFFVLELSSAHSHELGDVLQHAATVFVEHSAFVELPAQFDALGKEIMDFVLKSRSASRLSSLRSICLSLGITTQSDWSLGFENILARKRAEFTQQDADRALYLLRAMEVPGAFGAASWHPETVFDRLVGLLMQQKVHDCSGAFCRVCSSVEPLAASDLSDPAQDDREFIASLFTAEFEPLEKSDEEVHQD
ncbi:MAG: hypothetical protein K2X27_09515 [Candidatus Obscuribacterales bacterium]|nr:hypothetical protein [Candidatus Obscuribacterales bacterium]